MTAYCDMEHLPGHQGLYLVWLQMCPLELKPQKTSQLYLQVVILKRMTFLLLSVLVCKNSDSKRS